MEQNINEKEKPSLLINRHQKKATFVNLELRDTESFKNYKHVVTKKYISNKFIKIKTLYNTVVQGSRLKLQKVDITRIKRDVAIWCSEAFIEGAIINFSLWALFEIKMSLWTIFGFGFLIKELLSLYWRLNTHGTT